MNINTGIAVSVAVVVALAFLFAGSSLLSFFSGADATSQPLTTMESSSAELVITDVTEGAGATAEAGREITVEYVGQFEDGSVFDASSKHSPDGFTFVLGAGGVIAGWDQGLIGMKEGGVRMLSIPPSLGYGANDYGPIPGGSTLIFQVKLLKVQ
jgi:FKBP-type peptidyl-prolyl cis-trans isomerase